MDNTLKVRNQYLEQYHHFANNNKTKYQSSRKLISQIIKIENPERKFYAYRGDSSYEIDGIKNDYIILTSPLKFDDNLDCKIDEQFLKENYLAYDNERKSSFYELLLLYCPKNKIDECWGNIFSNNKENIFIL